MKWNYLFPNSLKKIGWILFIPSLIIGFIVMFGQWEPDIFNIKVFSIFPGRLDSNSESLSIIEDNFFAETIGTLIIIGGMLVAFSREKLEDEFISKIRLDSLVWAVYFNYAVLILSMVFIYGLVFFDVLVLNMFTLLIFFIVRFHWVLIKSKIQLRDEK